MNFIETKTKIFLLVSVFLGALGSIAQATFGQSWISTSGHAIGSDDAYISFRYAENLFNGNGLVFNVGEYVEGYSNFLYTLLMVPGLLLGKDFLYLFSVAVNSLFLSASLYLFWNFARKNIGERSANIGVLLMALNPWIWANIATGLETALVLFATIGLWVFVEKRKIEQSNNNLAGIFIFSLILIASRVDGFILPLIAASYIFITTSKKDGIKTAAFVILCMLFYTALRIYYYDDVIANTYYNKVSGGLLDRVGRGLDFLWQNLFNTGIALGLLCLAFQLANDGIREYFFKKTSFASFLSITWIFYLIYIGGDIYYERFIVQILPLIIYITLSAGQNSKGKYSYILAALLFVSPIYRASTDGRFQWSAPRYDMWIALGKRLSEAPSGTSLAIDAAGKVPFFSGLYTIDMLGLNDKHIGKMKPSTKGAPGHEKYDPEYVLSKQPTYIAAWISPSLDMGWGLNKEKYLEHYNIKYLLNSSRVDLGDNNIIEVSGLDLSSMQDLVKNSHNYGILLRKDDPSKIGQIALHMGKIRPGVEYPHNTNEVLFAGWSPPEDQHRWSSGLDSKILFNVDFNEKNIKGEVVLNFSTLGKQKIIFSLNGKKIYSNLFDGEKKDFSIPFRSSDLVNGINRLDFNFPDARQPGNGDPRILALALKSFQIR